MKKFNMKSFVMGIIVTVVLGTSTLIFGANTTSINVVLNKMKLVVNGKQVNQPTILYNGVTYAPFREIGEAFGQNVHYDPNTSTGYIGDAGFNNEVIPEKPTSSDTTYSFLDTSIPSFKKYSSSEQIGDKEHNEQVYIYLNVANLDTSVSNYEQDLVNAGYTRTEYKQEGPYTEIYVYRNNNYEVEIKKLPKANNKVIIKLELE